VGKGHNRISKGRYAGMRLFALTLEERATCPKSCGNWDTCYGDNSFRSVRWKHGPRLVAALYDDMRVLSARYPQGFVVRLHILGDFYSVPYVMTWVDLLTRFSALHIFGYTHWESGTYIGDTVAQLVKSFPKRVSILRSDGTENDPLPLAHTVGKHDPAVPGSVICPEQTGATESCLTCGLCMNGNINVSFRLHHRRA